MQVIGIYHLPNCKCIKFNINDFNNIYEYCCAKELIPILKCEKNRILTFDRLFNAVRSMKNVLLHELKRTRSMDEMIIQ